MINPPHRQILTGPTVWDRNDLEKDDSWRIILTDTQLDELYQTLAQLSENGLDPGEIQPNADRLPSWSKLIIHVRNELHQGRGVVFLRGIDTERVQGQDLQRALWLIGLEIGDPMVQNARGELLGEVTDRGHDYNANNVRGYTTRQALNFHCDASEIVALLCVHPAREGGASKIVCASRIHNELLEAHPEYLDSLYRGYHFDLRGEGALGDRNEITHHRVPVFHFHAGRLSIRFNHKTIVDGMRKADKPLTGIDREAVDCLADLARREDLVVPMDFQPGDIQWLSNHDVLHARDAFIDWDEPHRKRRLLRLWLTLPQGRPLRDDFSDRFNTGPKRGPAHQPGAGYWVGA